MKSKALKLVLTTVLIVAAAPVLAGPYDVGLTVGTLGVGVQAGMIIVPNKLDVRAGLSGLNYNYNTTSSGVDYSGELKLETVSVLGDWHPFEGGFRVTGGLFQNGNQFALTGNATSGNFTFNNNTYTAAQAGTVTASVAFPSVAPYIGFGWDDNSATTGFHFSSDVGLMYQGRPSATLTATGAATNAVLAADVQAAQTTLQNDLNKFEFYPVAQISLNYRF